MISLIPSCLNLPLLDVFHIVTIILIEKLVLFFGELFIWKEGNRNRLVQRFFGKGIAELQSEIFFNLPTPTGINEF